MTPIEWLSFLQLIFKVVNQVIPMIKSVWEQIRLEIKDHDYESAGKIMDKAIFDYRTAVYKKDAAAAAQALHELATGGNKK